MKDWLQSLAPRERAVILGGAAVLLAVVVYLAVVEPAVEAGDQRQQRVAALEQELAWMRGAAAELRVLGSGGAGANTSDRPPYLAVDRALREAGLPRPQTLEPVGAGGARVDLDGAAFDALIRVLDRLRSRDGLEVTRARFTRSGAGRVDAGLTLERAQ